LTFQASPTFRKHTVDRVHRSTFSTLVLVQIESTVRYLGIEVDDALAIPKQIDV